MSFQRYKVRYGQGGIKFGNFMTWHGKRQGIRTKGMEMALVWHEKGCPYALIVAQLHEIYTVNGCAGQCGQLILSSNPNSLL